MWAFKFMFKGKRHTCALGWESEGMTEDVVLSLWTKYATNRTMNTPPFSPAEEEEIQEQRKEIERKNTFGAVFEDCMTVKAVSVSSEHLKRSKGLYRNWIQSSLENIPLSELKASQIAAILENVKNGTPNITINTFKKGKRSPQTQAHVLKLIKSIWNYALDSDIVTSKFPARKIKITYDNERQFFFTKEQALQVLSDIRAGKDLKGKGAKRGSLDAWGMALLSLQTGLRSREILSLRWSDVEEQTIYETKNKKKSRRFYPTSDVLKMFEERKFLSKYTKPTDFVFPTENGTQLVQIPRIFVRCFIRLGINTTEEKNSAKRAVFHSFRHTFATWLAQKGTPMVILAALLGHSVLKTTERYVKYSPQNVEAIAASTIENLNQFSDM